MNIICAFIDINRADAAEGSRVTVRMADKAIVTRDAPRREAGLYWGYKTRLAANLSTVIAECPYEEGYVLLILR